ncbi:hypothetical protein MNV49_002592 [Pseudohyphozyma bogoriensis]|nr:hypothetical protein MNV49_002592 [Pseudohyphozyma bogoriensis]
MLTRKLVICGLGNYPYPLTKHSIGQILLTSLASHAASLPNATGSPHLTLHASKKAWTTTITLRSFTPTHDLELTFLKPKVLMNVSGPAIVAALPPSHPSRRVVTLQDDLDILPSKYKVQFAGSPKGHNGVRSLEKSVGKEFWRVRVGIGRPENKSDVAKWVLSPLGRDEVRAVEWEEGGREGDTVRRVWEEVLEIARKVEEMEQVKNGGAVERL